MKKLRVVYQGLFSILFVMMLFGAFSSTTAAKETIPLLVSGPPTQWTTYPIAVATSDLVNRNSNLNLTLRGYDGANAIVQALVEKQTQMCIGNKASNMGEAFRGVGDFSGKAPAKDLRGVIVYMTLRQTMIVPAKSKIMSITQLKGKRVAKYTSMPNSWFQGALEAYGIDLANDIIWVSVPREDQAIDEIRMGRIDAFYANPQGGDIMELAQAVGDLRPLPIEPDKFQQASKKHPNVYIGAQVGYIEPGWKPYMKVAQPVPVFSSPMLVGTRADVSKDIIYAYTKVWLDNMNKVATLTDALSEFNANTIKNPLAAVPYHEGAIKALKEAGMWTSEMDQIQEQTLKLAK